MKVVKATLIAAVVGLMTAIPFAQASSPSAPGKVDMFARSGGQHRVLDDPFRLPRSRTRSPLQSSAPDPYTRADLDLTGLWVLNTTFTLYHGEPVAENPPPRSIGANQTLWVALRLSRGSVSPLANDPVYVGDLYVIDPLTGYSEPDGKLIVTPFTSDLGIVLTMFQAENPDTGYSPTAYTCIYAARSVNDRHVPIDASGTWTDSRGSTGRVVDFHEANIRASRSGQLPGSRDAQPSGSASGLSAGGID